MPDGFKQGFRNFAQSKLISKTHPAIDGDEINFLLRINPRRNFVRQSFAPGNCHVKRYGRDIRVVGTSRCDVRSSQRDDPTGRRSAATLSNHGRPSVLSLPSRDTWKAPPNTGKWLHICRRSLILDRPANIEVKK